MTEGPVGVRVQRMPLADQALVLASIVAARTENDTFRTSALLDLFADAALPPPPRIDNIMTSLKKSHRVTAGKARGVYRLTPVGKQHVARLIGDDAASLLAEALPAGSDLGHLRHPLIPTALAPPQLVKAVTDFTRQSPAANHVFGMTRFPDAGEEDDGPDPVAGALGAADTALDHHGMRFLLASQRALVDDLWANVQAHMWSSNFGIAFFEDRRGRGMNYNLVIEVGAMLMAGRRCLLLKDTSIARMPTDFVGLIYKSVDLDDLDTVTAAVHEWVREDLGRGACSSCV